MRCVWHGGGPGPELIADGKLVGHVVPFESDGVPADDCFEEVSEGVFRWRRVFHRPGDRRFRMEFVTAYRPEYLLIPGVNYNGNEWGTGSDPKGFEHQGVPWSFAYHRTAVPGGTYSEGNGLSVALFADPASAPLSCSLVPGAAGAAHRLLWPEEEMPLSYTGRDEFSPGYRLEPERGMPRGVTAYLVVTPAVRPRTAWRRMLDVAWEIGRREVRPWFPPEGLWRLAVGFIKERLYAEENGFRGLSIGLVWDGERWTQRPYRKYEIGWAGQNASMAISLIHDTLRNGDRSSLEMGLAVLDSWATGAPIGNGLIHCVYDYVLGGRKITERLDACNLGDAAADFLEAYELADRVGAPRPAYRDVALGICDFAMRHQGPDGKLAKEWTPDGEVADSEGTIGTFFTAVFLKAHAVTGEGKYLDAAVRAYEHYMSRLLADGFTTAGALDTHCIDRESAVPLLMDGLTLFDRTGDERYLGWAEDAAYYIASWQWHHSVVFPAGTALAGLGYDTFGGTSVSTQHHHQDPYAVAAVPSLLRLAELTGKDVWLQRARAGWANATQGISDGELVVLGRRRPPGSQDEGFFHTRWINFGGVSDWLVCWPNAFRLVSLRRLPDWSVLDL